MILTITLNPCIDKSTKVDKLEPEAKLRCTEVVHEPGGGGINVSKALEKLSCKSIALFPAGGHNGEMLCSLLKKMNLSFHAIPTEEETRENWVVKESSFNNQYRFTFPGRAISEEAVRQLIDKITSYNPKFIVASGSLPPGLPDYFYGLIVEKAEVIGAKCIVDTSGAALKSLENKKAFLIKPNRGELCKLLGIEKIEKDEVPDAAKQAIKNGYAEWIAVSMGGDGAWLVSKEERYYCNAPKVERKSTVGAGDSMVAGITYMFSQNASPEEALRFGVCCGSAATMNEGTQLFDKETVYALYNLTTKTT
jgi:6-phosphofructokinase 2